MVRRSGSASDAVLQNGAGYLLLREDDFTDAGRRGRISDGVMVLTQVRDRRAARTRTIRLGKAAQCPLSSESDRNFESPRNDAKGHKPT
jgi:hypothetical protein